MLAHKLKWQIYFYRYSAPPSPHHAISELKYANTSSFAMYMYMSNFNSIKPLENDVKEYITQRLYLDLTIIIR